jgi:hypothetical protein
MIIDQARVVTHMPELEEARRPPKPLPPPSYVFGLDLGQVADYTALAILEKTEGPATDSRNRPRREYGVRHLKRWHLGTAYPQIVEEVKDLLCKLPGSTLVVDATGVGRAVVDMFRKARLPAQRLVAVTITGGHAVTEEGARSVHVPKKDLVGVVMEALQTHRLAISPGLKEAKTLKKELETFRMKLTAAAHETFEAWRERDHDDLVLAVALALYIGERPLRRLNIY